MSEDQDLREHDWQGMEYRDFEALTYASKISEFNDLHEFMQDDSLDQMIDLALRCLMEPSMRAETAKRLLVQFQAASFKFKSLGVVYTTIKKGRAGTDDNFKKNIYYALADECDKMAGALKYVARRDEA